MREEENKINKITIYTPECYNNGGCFGRTPNPKTLHETLTDQEEEEEEEEKALSGMPFHTQK
jgi:hypothetical protein